MKKYIIVFVVLSVTIRCNGHLLDVLGNAHKQVHATVQGVAGSVLGGFNLNFGAHVNTHGHGQTGFQHRPQYSHNRPPDTTIVVVEEVPNNNYGQHNHNGYQNMYPPNMSGNRPYPPGGYYQHNNNQNNHIPNGNPQNNYVGSNQNNYGRPDQTYGNQYQNYNQYQHNHERPNQNSYGNQHQNDNNQYNRPHQTTNGNPNQNKDQYELNDGKPDQPTHGYTSQHDKQEQNNNGKPTQDNSIPQTNPTTEQNTVTYGSVYDSTEGNKDKPKAKPIENKDNEQTTPKSNDEPLFVPLNPNEYVYGGDKINVTAPKRETDDNKKPAENDDEDFPIDIRFQDQ